MKTTTIGLDLAKSVFQVHGVDDAGTVTVRKKLRRAEVLAFFGELPCCLIGMEACATSHYWARELTALGHEVRLMPPNYVKPYVRRQKNDAADAEAICEAVTRRITISRVRKDSGLSRSKRFGTPFLRKRRLFAKVRNKLNMYPSCCG